MTIFDKIKQSKDVREMAKILWTYMCHWENVEEKDQLDLIMEYLSKEYKEETNEN